MCYSNGRIGFIYVLTTGTAGAVGIDAQVVLIDFDFNFFITGRIFGSILFFAELIQRSQLAQIVGLSCRVSLDAALWESAVF